MTKKNPWAICTASVGRKNKNKYERCVKGVKKESGMKENILKAAFQKHLSKPLKGNIDNFKQGFKQGYYELTPSGQERYKEKLKKLRQENPRKPIRRASLPENPRAKTRDQIKNELQARLKGDSTDIVRGARVALAEACWKGYKARGMKKKGNRMVPNCVKEATLDDLPTKMKLAARRARDKGEDPVDAAERVRKEAEARADQEHYGDKDIQENDSAFSDLASEEDINNRNNKVKKALQKRPRVQKNRPGPGRKLKKGAEPEYHETRKDALGSSTEGKAQRANTGRMVRFKNKNKSDKAMSDEERDTKTKSGADAAAINLSQRIADIARKKGLYKGRKHIGDRARAEAVRAGKQKLDRKRPKDS